MWPKALDFVSALRVSSGGLSLFKTKQRETNDFSAPEGWPFSHPRLLPHLEEPRLSNPDAPFRHVGKERQYQPMAHLVTTQAAPCKTTCSGQLSVCD